jgi:hypothetical protein
MFAGLHEKDTKSYEVVRDLVDATRDLLREHGAGADWESGWNGDVYVLTWSPGYPGSKSGHPDTYRGEDGTLYLHQEIIRRAVASYHGPMGVQNAENPRPEANNGSATVVYAGLLLAAQPPLDAEPNGDELHLTSSVALDRTKRVLAETMHRSHHQDDPHVHEYFEVRLSEHRQTNEWDPIPAAETMRSHVAASAFVETLAAQTGRSAEQVSATLLTAPRGRLLQAALDLAAGLDSGRLSGPKAALRDGVVGQARAAWAALRSGELDTTGAVQFIGVRTAQCIIEGAAALGGQRETLDRGASAAARLVTDSAQARYVAPVAPKDTPTARQQTAQPDAPGLAPGI